jgi:DNA transformation protein
METSTNNSLKGAKNIGPTILKRLHEIGIYSLADLAHQTPVKAYQKMVEQNPGKTILVCYYLYSLQAALLNVHWNHLPQAVKIRLLKQVGRWKKSMRMGSK